MKRNLIKLALGLALTPALVACDNAVFGSSGVTANAVKNDENFGETLPNGDWLFISDSFERENIFEDDVNNLIYGWRGAINDNGVSSLGFTGNQLGMEIFSDQQMGPAFDGNRALYFYGRPGTSTHTLYLVSAVFDMSNYNSVILSYRYLTVALNDQLDIDQGYVESIKLQTCNGPLSLCGAEDDNLNAAVTVSSPNWVTISESDPNADDDVFNGRNQQVSDYILDGGAIDLNDESVVGDKSRFVFRFVVTLRDGFSGGSALMSPATYGHDKDDKKHGDEEKECSKKKRHCEKVEKYKKKYCEKAEKYKNKCESAQENYHPGYYLLTGGKDGHSGNGHAYGHCIQKCIKGNIGHDAKKQCLHECKSCKKYDHYKKKCEKYKHKHKDCEDKDPTPTPTPPVTPTPTPPAELTLLDGVILDLVQGVATERDISELF